MAVNAAGSPVLPGKTRTATGRPDGSVSSPYSICSFPFLPSREYPRAASGQCQALQPRAGQVEQRHLRRVGLRAEVAAGQLRLDRVLPVLQPVHRGVDVIGGRISDAEVGAQGDISPPGQGGQLGGRGGDPGDDQGQGQVPGPARRAQQRGQAQLHRGRVHGGDVPVRRRGGDPHRLPGRDQPLALQGGLDRGHCVGRKRRQVRERLVPDLGAVPVGAPHQDRLIHSLLSGLRGIRPPVPGYMHRPATCRHNHHHNVKPSADTGATRNFRGYVRRRKMTGFSTSRRQYLRRATATPV